MIRHKVESSNIDSINFNPKQKRIEVEFKNGSIYSYYNCSKELFESIINGEIENSVGKSFNKLLRSQASPLMENEEMLKNKLYYKQTREKFGKKIESFK